MRYLALSDKNRKEMMQEIGIKNIDEIYSSIPDEFLSKEKNSSLPNHLGEIEVEKKLAQLSKKNITASDKPFFLGAGCYNHHIPASVDHIIQRSEFLTSYTPYQPEISQGTLATIFQFQSIISLLTGMDIANASMYDGSTALAEAILMAKRIKKKKNKIHIFNKINSDYIKVVQTFSEIAKIEFSDNIDEDVACVIVSYPDFEGNISELESIQKKCSEVGALLIVCVTEILSLGLLQAPLMADIVVGEASSIGVSMNFGGPHLGFFACKKPHVRQMPGRICGKTTDANGEDGYVLTLNAREQHIRRSKATSNICSNQGLCATAFTIHASLLGEIGIKKLALINHKKSCDLKDKLEKINGTKVLNKTFFNEFTVEFSQDSKQINKKLLEKNIIGGLAIEGNKMILACTELTTEQDMDELTKALEDILGNN
jgi:glycine dehydrogenase subunit 1